MKWFSVFTLFSIAISLIMVTCGASIWNMISSPIPPEVNKERTFFLNFTSNSGENGRTNVSELNMLMEISNRFINHDVYQFKTPELITVYDKGGIISDIIRNNKTKTINVLATDANFFKVFEFDFVAGNPYSTGDFSDEKSNYCVISENFANYYFGGIDCLGQIIVDRDRHYKVVGVVKKPGTTTRIKSDLYYMSGPKELARMFYMCNVVFLCHSKEDKDDLDAELKKWTYKNENGQLSLSADTSEKQYLTEVIGFYWELLPLYFVIVFIALIIPILCLIDILKNNQTLRNEELAIRRAFGAPRKNIIFLLLFDNLFITILAGVLGLVFSFLFFAFLSNDSWSNLFLLFFNWRAFFYYTAIFLIIGSIAGIIPALRLSRQQIVNALYAKDND